MRKEGGKEGRAKVAVAARRLMSLAKEVEGVEGAEAVSCRRADSGFERQADQHLPADQGHHREVLRAV